VSREEVMSKEAALKNQVYDPMKDEDLTLGQITKLIKDKNDEVRYYFK